MAVWIDGKIAGKLTVGRQQTEGERREIRVPITRGEHWIAASFLRQFEGLPPLYGAPNPTTNEIPAPRFRRRGMPEPPAEDATPEQIAEYNQQMYEFGVRNLRSGPDALKATWIEVVGPFDPVTGPSQESIGKIFPCGYFDGDHSTDCARKIISGFAHRAFRRPVSEAEVDSLMGFFERAKSQGRTFRDSIGLSLKATLLLPDFLFRIERDPAETSGDSYQISDHELASRLSYFLWSTMPDDELLAAADEGRLRQPGVLEAQISRMLRDPKTSAFVRNFGGQWLRFRGIETAAPDREKYPDFEDYLRMSMQQETEEFFGYIMREDRPILDFLDADYTFLNERLARHYGISGVEGPEFRKVDLSGTNRSGVLTQASVLTVTSYPNRTSPVLRGKFILENLLDTPPPPPPPNVELLDEETIGQGASLREQLEAHRTAPMCASCHNLMDPIGFSMENFDAIGEWRTEDAGFEIDPSGELPDGRTFGGADDLKAIFAADAPLFAEALTSKMLTYALGRGLERYDRRTVRRIAESLPEDDYRFSSLVLGIAESLPFQSRKRGE